VKLPGPGHHLQEVQAQRRIIRLKNYPEVWSMTWHISLPDISTG
jgi:hypothetical protein